MTRQRIVIVTAVALTTALGAPMRAAEGTEAVELIVRGVTAPAVASAVEHAGGTVDVELGVIDGVRATVPAGRVDDLTADSRVTSVVPDGTLRPQTFVDSLGYDPAVEASSMSAVTRMIGAQAMWDAGYTGLGVDIAMIDTGVTPVPGLDAARIVDGPDLSFDSQAPEFAHRDTYGHGTHLAGIAVGRDADTRVNVVRDCGTCTSRSGLSDSTRFVGVAPQARIVNVKVGATDGAADVSQVIAAIDWVTTHRSDPGLNIRVLLLAYGTDTAQDYTLDPLAFAVETAWNAGIFVVVSGGNDGTDLPRLAMPAADPFVMAVGATDPMGTIDRSDDTIPAFSNRSTTKRNVDVVAPGTSIISLRTPGSFIEETYGPTLVGTRLMRGSGTSQAAAVVAGAAALLVQRYPSATPGQLKTYVRDQAYKLPLGIGKPSMGQGQIDLSNVKAKLPSKSEQTYTPSAGTGPLEASRGSYHVEDAGVALVGEQDIFAVGWDTTAWAPDCRNGRAWSRGNWRSHRWSGDDWASPSRWAGAPWAGTTWAGGSWEASRWTGVAWDGNRWSGNRWSGNRWSGNRWSGNRWSGDVWAGHGWS